MALWSQGSEWAEPNRQDPPCTLLLDRGEGLRKKETSEHIVLHQIRASLWSSWLVTPPATIRECTEAAMSSGWRVSGTSSSSKVIGAAVTQLSRHIHPAAGKCAPPSTHGLTTGDRYSQTTRATWEPGGVRANSRARCTGLGMCLLAVGRFTLRRTSAQGHDVLR